MATPHTHGVQVFKNAEHTNNTLIFKNNINSDYNNNYLKTEKGSHKDSVVSSPTNSEAIRVKNEPLFTNTKYNYKLTSCNHINHLLNSNNNDVDENKNNNDVNNSKRNSINNSGNNSNTFMRDNALNKHSFSSDSNSIPSRDQQRKNSLDSLIKATQSVESKKPFNSSPIKISDDNNQNKKLFKINYNPSNVTVNSEWDEINHKYREKISRLIQAHQIIYEEIQRFPLYKSLEMTFPYLPNLISIDANSPNESFVDMLDYHQLQNTSQLLNNIHSIFDELVQLKKEKSSSNELYNLPALPNRLSQSGNIFSIRSRQTSLNDQLLTNDNRRVSADPTTTVLPSIETLTIPTTSTSDTNLYTVSSEPAEQKIQNEMSTNSQIQISHHKKSNSDPIAIPNYSFNAQPQRQSFGTERTGYMVEKPKIKSRNGSITNVGLLSSVVSNNVPLHQSYTGGNPRTYVLNSIVNPVHTTTHNPNLQSQPQGSNLPYQYTNKPPSAPELKTNAGVSLGQMKSPKVPMSADSKIDTFSHQTNVTPGVSSVTHSSSDDSRHNSVTEELLIAESMRKNEVTKMSCVHCNDHETPEWRRGPYGNRTLCNACGLFYRKLIKKFGLKSANLVMRFRKTSSPHDRRVPSNMNDIPNSHIKALEEDETLDENYNTIQTY